MYDRILVEMKEEEKKDKILPLLNQVMLRLFRLVPVQVRVIIRLVETAAEIASNHLIHQHLLNKHPKQVFNNLNLKNHRPLA